MNAWRLPALVGLVGIVLAAAVWLAAGRHPGLSPVPAQTEPQRLTNLTITHAGQRHLFHVEIARTGPEQERGLGYRDGLAPGSGMLFPFARPRPAAFWMEDTRMPLDMIFIGAHHRVTGIAARAQPGDRQLHASPGPVIAVLEIAGGQAAALHVAPGDMVGW